jgi:hypothetical protein
MTVRDYGKESYSSVSLPVTALRTSCVVTGKRMNKLCFKLLGGEPSPPHTHKCMKCLKMFLEMKLYVTGMSFNGLIDLERNMFEMYNGNSKFSFCN